MESIAYAIRFSWYWAQNNPLKVALIFLGLLGIQWLLNRKTQLEKDSERVVKELTDSNRGKYDDLRPLR